MLDQHLYNYFLDFLQVETGIPALISALTTFVEVHKSKSEGILEDEANRYTSAKCILHRSMYEVIFFI